MVCIGIYDASTTGKSASEATRPKLRTGSKNVLH